MKAHKNWSIAALICMVMTMISGFRRLKDAHIFWAVCSFFCMAMAMISGHKLIHKKPAKKSKKEKATATP